MKINIISFLLVGLTLTACSQTNSPWELVFEDNFNNGALDTNVWRRTYRGSADWQNTQSSDPRCIGFRDGCLLLRGIVNDNLETDTAHFLTGGVITEGLKPLPSPGRYEIRARLNAARGAWPALWLLPYDGKAHPWPYGGEIDIMERLNGDSIYYQTVHSNYTYNLHRNDPNHGSQALFNPNDFNVFGVDIYPDSLVWRINGKSSFSYRRVPEESGNGQWPFLIPQYLLMDMQLGGSWIGAVHPEDLPVEMEIDWVKVYALKEYAIKPKTLPENAIKWDFDNLDGWKYEHQDTATVQQASIADGFMTLKTRANTYDRTKIHTESREYGAGDYTWRIFIPWMAAKGQASISGFIYHDDEHELDFEIGYGKEEVRKELKAGRDEYLAYLTNQKHPYTSDIAKINPGWHDLTLQMRTEGKENYTATWLIDEKVVKTAQLEFGPKDATFHIYCSVENLKFLGDEMPVNDNFAKYNFVTFVPEGKKK